MISDRLTSQKVSRVSSDLENLEMSGILLQGEKVREFFQKQEMSGKSQGKDREFRCVKLIFSQSKHPNFENFPPENGLCPQTSLNSLGNT